MEKQREKDTVKDGQEVVESSSKKEKNQYKKYDDYEISKPKLSEIKEYNKSVNNHSKIKYTLDSEEKELFWKPMLDDYDIEKIVGTGTFGVVAKAYSKKLNKTVAIKRLENFANKNTNEY